MPNYNGVWSLSTQYQYAADWAADNPTDFNRAIFAGGISSSTIVDVIQFVTIATTGNSTDFGNLRDSGRTTGSGCSSSTRGIFSGGKRSGNKDIIDYVTMSSAGNATDFGNISIAAAYTASASSNLRGIIALGHTNATVNIIEYITIANTGNTTDFGNLLQTMGYGAALASPTRALIAGGFDSVTANAALDVIQYITIASTGNATDFGNLISARLYLAGGISSNTRGIFSGGNASDAVINNIEYVTIASTGNATDFGNLTVARESPVGTSSTTRGLIGGGSTSAYGGTGNQNVIDFITIASTGNASDFGDLLAVTAEMSACSTNHGGIA